MTATLIGFLAILNVLAPAALAQVRSRPHPRNRIDPHGAAVPNATVTALPM